MPGDRSRRQYQHVVADWLIVAVAGGEAGDAARVVDGADGRLDDLGAAQDAAQRDHDMPGLEVPGGASASSGW